MVSSAYLNAVVRQLTTTTLHQAGTGYRCRCGQCRHEILVTARRLGISPRQLINALPAERPVDKRDRRPQRHSMTSPVSGSMTVSAGRRQLTGPVAVLAVLGVEN